LIGLAVIVRVGVTVGNAEMHNSILAIHEWSQNNGKKPSNCT
jgi:hypothetical protein